MLFLYLAVPLGSVRGTPEPRLGITVLDKSAFVGKSFWCGYYVTKCTVIYSRKLLCDFHICLCFICLVLNTCLCLGPFICYKLIAVVLIHMEYKTCEEQLRYVWPFGTGCGRLKLPALAFIISLVCNFYCPLVRHIHVSHEKHPLALYVCPFTCIIPSLTGQIWYCRLLYENLSRKSRFL